MDAELQSALADAMRGESVLYVCYRYEDLHRLSMDIRAFLNALPASENWMWHPMADAVEFKSGGILRIVDFFSVPQRTRDVRYKVVYDQRLSKMAEIFGILGQVGYMYEQKGLGEK